MRIPKRVNAVLDWMEHRYPALGAVVALIAVALAATVAPRAVGFPVAGFILGVAAGGFAVHVRMSRRVARARADVDNLLRENGALRHRNTVLASGVITREAQETQALMSIPEDDLLPVEPGPREGDTQSTATLDELLDGGDGDPQRTDELPDPVPEPEAESEPATEEKAAVKDVEDDPQRTTVLPTLPDEFLKDDASGSARPSRPARTRGPAKRTRKS
ncbi:hypothetical protein [Actinomadura decatromicini]|uniref:Uncharacterized protein n=1 Tax=Actinomadura decatromicini TaxID=2604572 RepID=A0A5D3FYA0_9ACTN|nr:hypothetical protein [Actinomadura decatromicini]TYK52896.1 hypothetical protein FXF68_03865 [Actinomadura decatromicini]